MHSIPNEINPSRYYGVDDLFDALVQGVEFSAIPIDLIGGALQRGVALIEALECSDPHDVPHLREVALAQVKMALSLVLAWGRQSRREAREVVA